MALQTGISGLRGTVTPHQINLEAISIVQWVGAFVATLQKNRPFVAIGHDARRSSPALAALAKGALLMAGADVLDLGLTLTPTVQLAVRHDARLDAGIMITASHNPIIWNGLKLLDSSGFFLPLSWWDAMRDYIAKGNLPHVPLDQIGQIINGAEAAWQFHLQTTLNALPINAIRQKRYRIALDACNSGAIRWAELLKALGAEVILLHSELHGFFAREAEPLPANLGALSELVRHAHCDLGLAADPDGDRLVLVDGYGKAISEEHTVILVAMALAEQPDDCVVVNVVTTHALEEAIKAAKVIRTAVGEMNVVQGIITHNAVLGGEGSGGIIIPKINISRDGLAAAGVILTLMAKEDTTLDQLVSRIPKWQAVKGKLRSSQGSPEALHAVFARWKAITPLVEFGGNMLHLSSPEGHLRLSIEPDNSLKMESSLLDGDQLIAIGNNDGLLPIFDCLNNQRDALSLDLTDGIKLYTASAWLSLRPSNTEPIVRVMGEIKI